ncbi:autotransporter assembly complex protein TamA [Desulfobulbus alkaliphilus]|uniref:autotransporter assembly complex protein TamA n=1 Tax=Desulfobulbus alkaliphilus TaxID=869814 RepID=UPI0019644ECC|nr:autotransporter assembly complex family protein [Desulfobulbus alkaliphilus]MBM9536401.1 outer membrane protein assembly factor [Desulfobulbus alkaliphilus]
MTPCASPGPNGPLVKGVIGAVLLSTCLGLFPVVLQAALNNQLIDLLPNVLREAVFGSKPYDVEVRGDMDAALREILFFVSETQSLQDRPPASPEMLDRRARLDIPRMQRALRSEGYYDGQVEARVDHTVTPPLVIFEVRTGPPYILHTVDFKILESSDDSKIPRMTAEAAGLAIGQRARAPEIERGASRVQRFLRENGYPFPVVSLGEVVVVHAGRTMTVRFTVVPGPKAVFGPVEVKGKQRVVPEYIMTRVPWSEGQLFQASLLNSLHNRLMQDGLFATVNITYPEQSLPDASREELVLPVTITVAERVPRTIKAGLAYDTDIGLGTVLDWEHRNLFGQAERLRTRLVLAEKEQALSSDLRLLHFLHEQQSLNIAAAIGREQTEAYDKEYVAAGAALFRQLGETWSAGIGVKYGYSETTQGGVTQDYGLFSVPGELAWDKRNDLLDPVRGWHALVRAEPFIDTLETGTRFFKVSGGLSAYVPFFTDNRLVLAGRGMVGSIMGESSRNLPPNERYYVGGGGSVRGYAYQSIGPEEDGVVIGGRSAVECSVELRLRMRKNFGLVGFLDGGQVFPGSQLQWEDDFFWGAGLGVRYFTDFAPIRLDVAIPLNKRDKDDSFQVYVSIGQAF